ncbi:MAG TPA: hypothetical protein VGH35_05185 [Gaiellaceae bacterium]|jgi:hypothetical protein
MNVAIAETGAQRRAGSIVLAVVAAIGWFFLAVLGFLVKVALFRAHRSHGATAVLWGAGFALFLWLSSLALGLQETRAILFALVAGAAIALFVYLRGAGLEDPPAARPGEFYRRLRSPRRARTVSQPDVSKSREVHRARVELVDGDLDGALYYLRQAERVAVAQRKLDELLEVRDVLRSLPRTPASAGLAHTVDVALQDFPPEALAAAGIHVRTERELVESLRPLVQADDHGAAKPRPLSLARRALDAGDYPEALFQLQEARRIAVAQRRLAELLEVHELVQPLCERSSGRTRAAAEELARQVVAGLRSFLPAAAY